MKGRSVAAEGWGWRSLCAYVLGCWGKKSDFSWVWVSFGVDGNVLKLDHGNSCRTLYIYLTHGIVHFKLLSM